MSSPYNEIILDHFRNPRNYGRLASPDVVYEEVNPLCGDRIRIELEIRDRVITAAQFVGDGCAISIAAASILTGLITGANIESEEIISDENLIESLASEIKPSRRKCALLPLAALRSGVEHYKRDCQR